MKRVSSVSIGYTTGFRGKDFFSHHQIQTESGTTQSSINLLIGRFLPWRGSWTLSCNWCQSYECVELYLHASICFHCVVFIGTEYISMFIFGLNVFARAHLLKRLRYMIRYKLNKLETAETVHGK